ncbi:MAG: nucleotidyl transferase AbiEii/AbiGii toxin family protein [Opitutales bacterium]
MYYEPIVPQARPPSIQIDVIESESPYARIDEQPVRVPFLEQVEAIKVPMPSASCLLGDKLAAFAPSTIGYPYEPISRGGRETEPRPIKVLKHLFDLGVLAELGDNMTDAIASYERIFAEQLKFRADIFQRRGIAMTPELALDDSQDAAFWAARVGGRRLAGNEKKLIFMQNGIRALRSHLFTEPFAPAQTRLAAGRATLLAEIVRKGATDFDLPGALKAPLNVEYINGTQLEDPWVDLNTIKGTNTDAYVLWEQAQRLQQQ